MKTGWLYVFHNVLYGEKLKGTCLLPNIVFSQLWLRFWNESLTERTANQQNRCIIIKTKYYIDLNGNGGNCASAPTMRYAKISKDLYSIQNSRYFFFYSLLLLLLVLLLALLVCNTLEGWTLLLFLGGQFDGGRQNKTQTLHTFIHFQYKFVVSHWLLIPLPVHILNECYGKS